MKPIKKPPAERSSLFAEIFFGGDEEDFKDTWSMCCPLSMEGKCFLCAVLALFIIFCVSLDVVIEEEILHSPALLDELLMVDLPEFLLESVQDPETPQSVAYEWLVQSFNQSELMMMEKWRKHQIFALATIYFAMDGPTWSPAHQARWLNSSFSECEWTNSRGNLRAEDNDRSLGEEMNHTDELLIQCSLVGRVSTLRLGGLGESEVIGSLPAEVALLSSLESLNLDNLELKAKSTQLEDLLPFELTHLSNMKAISCQGNKELSGTIPTYLGQLSSNLNMTHLLLGFNALSGTIPSELGLLDKTHLSVLDFSGNQLTGTVPSELALLPDLKHIGLTFLPGLSGVIPTELCHSKAKIGAPPSISLDCLAFLCPKECNCVCVDS